MGINETFSNDNLQSSNKHNLFLQNEKHYVKS